MSFDGSGTYSLPAPPSFPAVSGTTISSTYFNNVMNDVKTALNLTFLRDGQAAATDDFNLNNFSIANLLAHASNLALSSYNDSNTGVRFPAADEIDLVAGGNANFHMTASGGDLDGDWTVPTQAFGEDSEKVASTAFVQDAVAALGSNVQEFTSSGTWTKPTGATLVLVEVWGAGGGGASGCLHLSGSASVGGGGGGGGGYAFRWFNADDLSATESVTVGAGGTGATGAGPSVSAFASGAGNNGGSSYFSSSVKEVKAYGGYGGAGASIGATTSLGGNGGQGYISTNLATADNAPQDFMGGVATVGSTSIDSFLGGGAGGSCNNSSSTIMAGGKGYQAGNGGGCGSDGAATTSGGAGSGRGGVTAAGGTVAGTKDGTAGSVWCGGGGGACENVGGGGISAGNGGAGGRASGGGGGGSGTIAPGGTKAGNGGNGGDGYVRVTSFGGN